MELKSIKKQMSLTYNTRANLKVNEDAKNFRIKIKNGSLRMLTKKKTFCVYLVRSVDFRLMTDGEGWVAGGRAWSSRNRHWFGVENEIGKATCDENEL